MQASARRLTAKQLHVLRGGIAVVILLGLIFNAGSYGRPLAGDCRRHGTLTYFGAPAPVGTRVQARIGDQIVADTAVTVAGQYAISIPPDDPQTTICDGWDRQDIITIWVGGHEGRPQFPAFEGSHPPINIEVSAIALDVKRSTWGKIKALFR